MNKVLKKKAKSPLELVKLANECLISLVRMKGDEKEYEKVNDDLSKVLNFVKTMLTIPEAELNPEAAEALAKEIQEADLIPLLLTNLEKLEFEAKKDVVQIFSSVLRRQEDGKQPVVAYMDRNHKILDSLVDGTENPDIALNCGSILRECIKHESLCRYIVYSQNFFKYFKFVEMSNFDGASDAFATFKDLLTKHRNLAAEYLESNFDQVFEAYTALLQSQNYVTRRQSLKLLGDLLMDRSNFNIMTRYISNPANLKLMMNLLRDKSKSIQLEAFHVFKLFVANPKKPKPIVDILLKNKEKLIMFLKGFRNDKEDEQFADDKAVLIREISQL